MHTLFLKHLYATGDWRLSVGGAGEDSSLSAKLLNIKTLKTNIQIFLVVNLCAECQFSSVSLLLCCVETTCMAIKICVDYEYDSTLLVVLWRPLVGFTASCCLVQGCSSWVLFCCWFFKRFEQTSAVFAFIRYLCWLQMSLSVVFLLFRSLTDSFKR